MVDWLPPPFDAPFMQRALLAACLAGVNCALIGVYIVLRRMAFISGALAHTILPGIVLAWMAGIAIFWGALAAGLATALGVGWLAGRARLREDTAIGIMLSAMFALGVLLMSATGSFQHFDGLLFGSILGVTDTDLGLIAASTVAVAALLALLHKELELASMDAVYAGQIGARPHLMRYLVLVLAALSVVSAVKVVGALLTTALLIIPAAAATQLARSVPVLMGWAVGVALVSAVAGLSLSYYRDFSPGACIVLAAAGLFLIAWAARAARERLSQRRSLKESQF